MKSVKGKTYGLYTAIFGGCGIAATYMAGIQNEPMNMGFSLVIGFGLVLYFGGMILSLGTQLKRDKSIHQDDTAMAASAIIRCMLAISVADEQLDDQEVRMISKIYKKLTGSDVSEELIRDTAQLMIQEGIDLAGELMRVRDNFDKGLKQKILRASLYILAADGSMDEDEEEMLEIIGEGLGIAKGAVKTAKKQFLEEVKLRKAARKPAQGAAT